MCVGGGCFVFHSTLFIKLYWSSNIRFRVIPPKDKLSKTDIRLGSSRMSQKLADQPHNYLFLTPNSRSVFRAGVSLNIDSFIPTPQFLWFISKMRCCKIYIHVYSNIPCISYSPKCYYGHLRDCIWWYVLCSTSELHLHHWTTPPPLAHDSKIQIPTVKYRYRLCIIRFFVCML